jgi:dTDP-4-dehydrorhamnose reductase
LKKKIIIFGSRGNLGGYLIDYLNNKYTIISEKSLKKKINFENIYEIKKILLTYNPQTIINLIAKTDVDECEIKKNLAKKSNQIIVKNITEAIKSTNIKCHFIHISTDQVYSGKGHSKNSETDSNPINYYGKTKFWGENEALKINSTTILRTNFVGSNKIKNKYSLSDWIVNSLEKNKKIRTYSNITFNPLYIKTFCKYINVVIRKKIYGIYNIGSKNSISKYNFSSMLCKYLKLNKKLIQKTFYNKSLSRAKRPLNMSLNIKKFEKTFDINLPNVKKEIALTGKDYLK